MLGLGHLQEFRAEPRKLAHLLYWEALAAPGVLRQKDGSLLGTIQFRGPDMESSGASELISLSAHLNQLLKGFGTGWGLCMEARRVATTAYPCSSWPDAISGLVDEERRATFTAPETHFESTCYLSLTSSGPSALARQVQRWLWTHLPDDTDVPHESLVALFRSDLDHTAQLLGEFCPMATVLDDEALLSYLHSCVSTKQHAVQVPAPPCFLDTYMTDMDLTGGIRPRLGDAWLRPIAVKAYPEQTYPGIVESLERLGVEYRYVLRYLPMDRGQAVRRIRRYRRAFLQGHKRLGAKLMENFTGHTSGMIEHDQVHYAEQAGEAMAATQHGHLSFGYSTHTVLVWDPDFSRAEEKRRAVEHTLNNQGFVTRCEDLNAVNAWLGSLPGDCYHNVRKPLLHSLNLAHLAPATSLWAGPARVPHMDGPPLLYGTGEGQTPFRLALHDGDVGHTLILGPTGSGKSTLLALMALQWRRYPNSRVIIFDKGGSAKCATLAVQAPWYALEAGGTLAFQPLAGIDESTERAWAAEWVLDLLDQEQVILAPDIKEEVWLALSNLAISPPCQRTVTGLVSVLQSRALRQALQPYTVQGPFGSLLDAEADTLTIHPWQTFEMEALLRTRRIVPAVLLYLFHRLEHALDGAPTLLILDEAWLYLDTPTFAERIREWLKTLRKKNAVVCFASQSLADITQSPIAAAVIESCPTRIFLPNPRALEPGIGALYTGCGLTERQRALIAQAVPKRDYYYQSRAGQRLFRLELGPVALAFCGTSDLESLHRMEEVWQHDPALFASHWLTACGLPAMAALVCPNTERTTSC